MGADLYRRRVFDENSKKWEAKFNDAVKLRNEAEKGSEAEKHYQEHVSEYYEKMYEVGYYRDSYNDSNLLWQFDLDYWQWFGKLLNAKSELTPTKAKEVLAELKKREDIFTTKLKALSEDDDIYFRGKYDQFKKFLTDAIEAKEAVECSI